MRNGVGNPIPDESRLIVTIREHRKCARCGGFGTDWHHRRSRRVRDEWTHHPINGVLLCRTCHDSVHSHGLAAKATGYVVSSFCENPIDKPIKLWWGWVTLTLEGGYQRAEPPEEYEELAKIIQFPG